MANRSSNMAAPRELVAWLGRLLMALVAGKNRWLRETIASAVARAWSHDDMKSMTHWHARQNSASNRRVE
jgi:hypothetical protein